MKKFWRYDPPGIQVWHVKEGRPSDPVVQLEYRLSSISQRTELTLEVRFWIGYGHMMTEFQPLFSMLEAYDMSISEDYDEILVVLKKKGYEHDQDHCPM